MGETAIAEYPPKGLIFSGQRERLLNLLAEHTDDAQGYQCAIKAGYSQSYARQWRQILKNPVHRDELDKRRRGKSDKARVLLDRGDKLLEKGALGAEKANDYQTMGVLGAQHVKLGLEYKEKHGESEEHDPTTREKALRKGHLRLAYSILRATAVWEPARLLDYLERVRRELDIDPTAQDTPRCGIR